MQLRRGYTLVAATTCLASILGTALPASATTQTSEGTDPGTNATAPIGGGGYTTLKWTAHGKTIYMRGDAQQKAFDHNLSGNTVRVATQQAQDVHLDSGTSYVYRTTINKYDNGKITGTVVVRTPIDFKKYGSETFGVITSYCEGTKPNNVCPSWVNEAIG